MQVFIDSVSLKEIKEAATMGIASGVTTNPTLIAKEGFRRKDEVFARYREICDLVEDNVSAEVIATDCEGMLQEGRILASISPKIVVKVPITEEGLKAIRQFALEGIRTNCTLVFSPIQALLAAQAGATFVSCFVGRVEDVGEKGLALIEEVMETFSHYESCNSSEVLAASIRSPLHVVQCAAMGVDIVTCKLSLIRALIEHPQSKRGLDKFLSDYHQAFSASTGKPS